jgi:hypothetical protein
LSNNLNEASKLIVKKIFAKITKLLEDAKSSKMTIAKLKSMLGFYSKKQKK